MSSPSKYPHGIDSHASRPHVTCGCLVTDGGLGVCRGHPEWEQDLKADLKGPDGATGPASQARLGSILSSRADSALHTSLQDHTNF